MQNIISSLLKLRDDTMGETVALIERAAELHNDLEAIDRVLQALHYDGDLARHTVRQSRVVIFHRNELRQFLLNQLRKGDPLSSRDLAERICGEEGKDIRDVRMVLDVTRRVSKAMRLLQDVKAVRGVKDRMRRYGWQLT